MSSNELMKYFKTKGFEDLIEPNIPGSFLEIFPLSEVKDAYNKILNGEKVPPPKGAGLPEFNLKNLKGLEDAVKEVQERTGLDDDQMKEVLKTLIGEEGSSAEKPLVFSNQHEHGLVKKSSAVGWVTSYFLSILPIGHELNALLYLLAISSNPELVKDALKKNNVINIKHFAKSNKALGKFKPSDVNNLLKDLSIESEALSLPSSGIDNALKYATGIMMALLAFNMLNTQINLLNVDTMAVLMSESIGQIDALADEIKKEILQEAIITLLISIAATPAAAIAIQLRRVYKVKKFANRFKKLVKLRKSMYKILDSKSSRTLLKIDSSKGYSDAARILDNDIVKIGDIRLSVKKIRKKLGIKKKSSFNNSFITKLAIFLEKNNLLEELKILEKEIL
jgi:hypothetical protein